MALLNPPRRPRCRPVPTRRPRPWTSPPRRWIISTTAKQHATSYTTPWDVIPASRTARSTSSRWPLVDLDRGLNVPAAATDVLDTQHGREHGRSVVQEPVARSEPVRVRRGIVGVAQADLEVSQVALQGGTHLGVPFTQRDRQRPVTVGLPQVARQPGRAELGVDTRAVRRWHGCVRHGCPRSRHLPHPQYTCTFVKVKPRRTAGLNHVAGASLRLSGLMIRGSALPATGAAGRAPVGPVVRAERGHTPARSGA